MADDAPKWSWQRFKWAWKLFRASRAEAKGDFERAIQLLDEAAQMKALWHPERVQRAMLLLRNQQTREATQAFNALRAEFKGSDNPDLQYLRRYCTSMVSGMTVFSAQWAYEAEQAQKINCRRSLKRRFPMTTIEEIHERIKPRP